MAHFTKTIIDFITVGIGIGSLSRSELDNLIAAVRRTDCACYELEILILAIFVVTDMSSLMPRGVAHCTVINMVI